jgi:hypothetical protein
LKINKQQGTPKPLAQALDFHSLFFTERRLGLQYGLSLFNLARASGRQFVPGLDAPVQEEGLV